MKQMPNDQMPVPAHFREDMEAFVRELDGAERLLDGSGAAGEARTAGGADVPQAAPGRRTVILRIAAVAASLALVAGLGSGLYSRLTAPKDTFDDPMLAYATVEAALNRVSRAAGKGIALERESETYLHETLSIFNR